MEWESQNSDYGMARPQVDCHGRILDLGKSGKLSDSSMWVFMLLFLQSCDSDTLSLLLLLSPKFLSTLLTCFPILYLCSLLLDSAFSQQLHISSSVS